MTALYFAALALLTVAAYTLSARRSAAMAGVNGIRLHSLPAYHGLLAASLVFVPMLLIYVIGSPAVMRLAASNALSLFPADVQNNPLQSGSALRDIYNLSVGQHSGEASDVLKSAASAYTQWLSTGAAILFACGVGAALLAPQRPARLDPLR